MIRTVFVSDLHCGHKLGLALPKNELELGDYRANEVQLRLFDFWTTLAADWSAPDNLVVVGDAIDGQGGRNRGVEQWSTQPLDQVRCAMDLLTMWSAKRIFILAGTDWHTSINGLPAEDVLAQELNAERIPAWGNRRAGDELYLTTEGVTMHIAHSISISSVWHYRPTPIAREMLFSSLNDAFRSVERELNRYKTRLVVRAHAHFFVNVRFTSRAGLILPGWQAKTPYMTKKSPLGMMPDVGAIQILAEGDQYEQREAFRKIEHIQDPPHVVIE